MRIDSKAWIALSEESRIQYIRWFGKVFVVYGDYVQEIRHY
jgi:hypothetical protein